MCASGVLEDMHAAPRFGYGSGIMRKCGERAYCIVQQERIALLSTTPTVQ